MPTHPRYSSTMRIDLPPDAEDISNQQATPVVPAQADADKPAGLPGGEAFRELFESVYDAALVTGLDGIVICGNSRAEEFFQIPQKRFGGMDITEWISGADQDLVTTIKNSLERDRFILIQAYCCRADGSTFPAEVSVTKLTLAKQHYLNFFIRDITFRKEAEEKLRTGHTAIQNSGNGIAVTDLDGDLQYFNPAMSRLLGLEADTQGRPIENFLCNPGMSATIRETIHTGRTWEGELQLMCGKGRQAVAVLASVAPNLDAEEDLIGMVWSLLDISDQKRIQNELRQHNAQLADDLNLANEFQLAFIQREYPTFPVGVDQEASITEIGHIYIPSGAVGGDFFEVFAVSLNRVGIFISDVMGHGVRSALIVATIRGLIEELGPFRYDPAAFLSHMNRDLARIISHPGQTMFATAFYLVLDLTTGEMEWASAGHPPPLLMHADGVTLSAVKPQGPNEKVEPALGLFPDTAFHSRHATIAPGDMLVLYTDGITESENDEGDIFDEAGIETALREQAHESVADCLEQVVLDAQDFTGNPHFNDDVCLIGMRLRALLPATSAV